MNPAKIYRVFALIHIIENENDNDKVLGVYSTFLKAEKALTDVVNASIVDDGVLPKGRACQRLMEEYTIRTVYGVDAERPIYQTEEKSLLTNDGKKRNKSKHIVFITDGGLILL